MCNLYTIEKGPDAVRRIFADLQVPLEFPEGVPNFQPRDVRISERAPIVKFDRDRGVAQLVERRWSWRAPGGKPVFNMRSDGREFSRDRCLVLADAFYEFTTPSDSKQKRKDCWRFDPSGDFAIAGILRDDPQVGEAFTLLTVRRARTSPATTTARSRCSTRRTGANGSTAPRARPTCSPRATPAT